MPLKQIPIILKNNFRLLIIFSILHIAAISASGDGYRIFTDTQNRTITAKPINVIGKQFRIKKDDGSEYTINKEMLVERDQKYLESWALNFLAKEDRLLEIEVKRGKRKVDETKKELTTTSGRILEDALLVETFDGYYTLKLINRTELELNNLRVEYRLFSEQDELAAKRRKDIKLLRKNGSKKIDFLPAMESVEFDSEPIQLVETKLLKGSWAKGGARDQDAKLAGIWVKIYNQDQELISYSLPNQLSSNEDW